jgi:L-alanine-DL-glutamate epimerase-like enolase superfamily enzyme
MSTRIADIRTFRLRVPFVDPPKTGFLVVEAIDLLIVEVELANGVIGTGYLHLLGTGVRTAETCIHEMLAPLLEDQSVDDVPALWDRMWRGTFTQGRMGISVMAMSALDVALWDALGRHLEQPLWQVFGGERKPLPVYGSGCFRGLGHDGMIEKAERFVADGFSAIKMQVAHLFTADEDVANVRDMRQAMGDTIEIMVDVNQGWTADEAIAVGKRLDTYGLTWLEEPVMADDFDGYHAVAEALETPIAGGENHFTHRDLAPFFASGAVPYLQPDIMRGGFTDLLVTSQHAHSAGLQMAPHLFPELSAHLLAAIPNGAWLEHMGWHDHLWTEPMVISNGKMTPSDRPGHGMTFKPELFTEYTV